MRPERFDDFIGCDALVGQLSGVAGEPVHAYLFLGPEGTGKRALASICARALNCVGADKPCDECPSCKRYLTGNHPDHIVVKGEKSIGVSEVRDLTRRVSIRPYEGGRLTVIIERADTMTVQAQNALLKTLEEPPKDVVFILTAVKSAPLLQTVRSRVRLIRFAPIADESVERALAMRGVDAPRARLLAALSGGAVGRALALDGDEAYWALRERVIQALTRLKGVTTVADAFSIIKDDKAESARVLDIIEQIARAKMMNEFSDPPDAQALPAGIDIPGDALLKAVMRARQMMASNVSWQSAVEMMCFDVVKRVS